MEERMLSVQEVAVMLGVSVHTINLWYMWKKQNPENEIAKLLPEFIQVGQRQARKWKTSDLWKFTEFRSHIKTGRGGFMGITSKYYKKEN